MHLKTFVWKLNTKCQQTCAPQGLLCHSNQYYRDFAENWLCLTYGAFLSVLHEHTNRCNHQIVHNSYCGLGIFTVDSTPNPKRARSRGGGKFLVCTLQHLPYNTVNDHEEWVISAGRLCQQFCNSRQQRKQNTAVCINDWQKCRKSAKMVKRALNSQTDSMVELDLTDFGWPL